MKLVSLQTMGCLRGAAKPPKSGGGGVKCAETRLNDGLDLAGQGSISCIISNIGQNVQQGYYVSFSYFSICLLICKKKSTNG